MILTLDGRRIDPPPDCATLAHLLRQVRSSLDPSSIVVGVSLDGAPLTDQSLSDALARTLEGVAQLDLETQPRTAAVAAALRESADRLELAGAAQGELAALFTSGPASEAARGLSSLLNVWAECHQALSQSSELLARDLGSAEIDGATVQAHLEQLADRLRELRDAFESRDYVLVSDLLAYEMPGLCTRWRELLESLATEVAAR